VYVLLLYYVFSDHSDIKLDIHILFMIHGTMNLKNQAGIYVQNLYFEIYVFCEIMWKYTLQPNTAQMTVCYGSCVLYTGWIMLQAKKTITTYYFATSTMVTQYHQMLRSYGHCKFCLGLSLQILLLIQIDH
jgi:hypothetical protein